VDIALLQVLALDQLNSRTIRLGLTHFVFPPLYIKK